MSDEKVQEIIDSGKSAEIVQQALVSDNLQDTVRMIEERHDEILKLERQVREIFELFNDLAQLVDLQQESLDVISVNISNAQRKVVAAEEELVSAADYQKKARNVRAQPRLTQLTPCMLLVLSADLLPNCALFPCPCAAQDLLLPARALHRRGGRAAAHAARDIAALSSRLLPSLCLSSAYLFLSLPSCPLLSCPPLPCPLCVYCSSWYDSVFLYSAAAAYPASASALL